MGNASNVGGDIEVIMLLQKLLEAGHEVHLVSRNRNDWQHPRLINHWAPGGIFENPPEASRHHGAAFDLYDSWLRRCQDKFSTNMPDNPLNIDAAVFWLGQHGSSVHPVPAVQEGKAGSWTNPMGSDVNYAWPVVSFCNNLGIRPIWLCPDPRNMVKFRDLWDPKQRTILAQFNTSKDNTFYDERDGKLRSGQTRYTYSGIELLAVPPESVPYVYTGDRDLFGLLVNEGYSNLGSKGRLAYVKSWTKDLMPYELIGTWCDKSAMELQALGIPIIESVPLNEVHATLQNWRCTMTFPATASGWATAKPWECFRAGTVCFRHPEYDTQNHIYGPMPEDLRKFLSPPTPSGLRARLEDMKNDSNWRGIVAAQHAYYLKRVDEMNGGAAMVEHACAVVFTTSFLAEGKDYHT